MAQAHALVGERAKPIQTFTIHGITKQTKVSIDQNNLRFAPALRYQALAVLEKIRSIVEEKIRSGAGTIELPGIFREFIDIRITGRVKSIVIKDPRDENLIRRTWEWYVAKRRVLGWGEVLIEKPKGETRTYSAIVLQALGGKGGAKSQPDQVSAMIEGKYGVTIAPATIHRLMDGQVEAKANTTGTDTNSMENEPVSGDGTARTHGDTYTDAGTQTYVTQDDAVRTECKANKADSNGLDMQDRAKNNPDQRLQTVSGLTIIVRQHIFELEVRFERLVQEFSTELAKLRT